MCYCRGREDDSTAGYMPRWRRRNADDHDIASSSNASSMTDLHVARKDSSASDNSNESGTCRLTYENLRLHDKLSSQSPPYSSLSRLEETPSSTPVPDSSRTPDTVRHADSSGASLLADTPTNGPNRTSRYVSPYPLVDIIPQ